MFTATHSGANANAPLGVATGVMTATLHRPTALLVDDALKVIVQPLKHLPAGLSAERGRAARQAGHQHAATGGKAP